MTSQEQELLTRVPNPGSEAALDMGCKCAVLDNGHGAGYMGQPGIFVISGDCPLHGIGHGVDAGLLPVRATPSEAYGPGEKT